MKLKEVHFSSLNLGDRFYYHGVEHLVFRLYFQYNAAINLHTYDVVHIYANEPGVFVEDVQE